MMDETNPYSSPRTNPAAPPTDTAHEQSVAAPTVRGRVITGVISSLPFLFGAAYFVWSGVVAASPHFNAIECLLATAFMLAFGVAMFWAGYRA